MFRNGGLVKDIDTLLSMNPNPEVKRKWTKNNGVCEYLNMPAAFDIEVSSFYQIENGQAVKHSCMYIWMFGINGDVVIGRDWHSFTETMQKVKDFYHLSEERLLPVYVHNLGYEFGSTFNTLFHWSSVFARDTHSPMKAVCDEGFEFRCSYMLAGQSLAGVGKDLVKYKVQKMTGDLDYDKLRLPADRATGFPGTPLDAKEMGYCINDVLVVMAFIKEEMELVGDDITKIPLTKTGKVRSYCKDKCLRDKTTGKSYRELMRKLTISGVGEYEMLKRAFQGGFTHASYQKAHRTHKNVKSWDFTSSYPTVMVSEYYPMSSATKLTITDINHYRQLAAKYLLIFDVKFEGLVQKNEWENPISASKCFNDTYTSTMKPGVNYHMVLNNGRVSAADSVNMTITNIDFTLYEEYYDWDTVTFGDALVYEKGYLPTTFVECILDFYEGKTTLKDVVGQEMEYLLKKGLLNSCYGCSVQDVINEEIEFKNGVWSKSKGNVQEQIDDYNTSSSRFLYYPWGVFVTAYARRNLFYGITEFGKTGDYIYSDTDSVKVTNYEDHMDFIDKYNKWIIARLEKACRWHKIDVNRIRPKTVKGKEKPLGVWDDDGFYQQFKTLGSKRYMVDTGTEIKTTIAGANKKAVSKLMTEMKENGEDPFKFFRNEMTIDKEHSGRMIVTYIPTPMVGITTDYLGNRGRYLEMCGVHMEKSEYNLTITPAYLDLCRTYIDGLDVTEEVLY